MPTATALPTKKAGQRYTKKELMARGWSDELLCTHLTECRDKKDKVYYRASEVAEAAAKPEVAAALEASLERLEFQARAAAVPCSDRQRMSASLAKTLTEKFAAMHIEGDELSVAKVWHSMFLSAMGSQPKESAPSIPRQENLLKKIGKMARKFDAATRAEEWKKTARNAWIVLFAGADTAAFISEYFQILAILVGTELAAYRKHDVTIPIADVLSIPAARADYPMKKGLYQCYVTYYVPESISRDLTKLLAVDPKDEYPEARLMKRRFEIHVGGTNTGKTYQSLQRLKGAPTGVYLAPLRLLALEVQERLLDDGVVCSMLTGEEEDIRPGATHISSTVEKLDIKAKFDVAVIDECQMICDTQRGYAWTRAILGVQAEEIHLCVAPEGLNILLKLIDDLGEPYNIVQHERKTPLTWEDREVGPKQAKKGDAFVAFSKKKVLQMAEILKQHGHPASIIYGNLPYSTRRQQMQRFLDGETNVLVATDAIGMGLNLPIRRVIFLDDEKYDGIETRGLKAGEVRQIAGRAGRYGIYDEGIASPGPECEGDLGRLLNTIPEDVKEASLGFSELVLSVNHPLIEVLRVWNRMPVKAPYVRMDISRHIFVINYIEAILKLKFTKEEELRAGNIPFDEKNEKLLAMFGIYCKAYADGETTLPFPEKHGNYLEAMEQFYKELDLYYSFSKTFGMVWDQEQLSLEKEAVAYEINQLLIHELKSKGASCRRCGARLSLFSPYRLCEKCHREIQRERRMAALCG